MPVPAIFVTALVVAAARRSVWAGVQVTVWTALLTSLAFYAIAVSEAVLWYQDDSSLILAGDAVKPESIGENIRNFAWFLILFPYVWAPFGVIGAAIGRPLRVNTGRMRRRPISERPGRPPRAPGRAPRQGWASRR